MSVEQRMQDAAEARLEEIEHAWCALEDDPRDEEALSTLGLWCGGCDTCTVREVLDAAIPILLDAIRSGEFELSHRDVMSNLHHFPGAPR